MSFTFHILSKNSSSFHNFSLQWRNLLEAISCYTSKVYKETAAKATLFNLVFMSSIDVTLAWMFTAIYLRLLHCVSIQRNNRFAWRSLFFHLILSLRYSVKAFHQCSTLDCKHDDGFLSSEVNYAYGFAQFLINFVLLGW